MQPSHHRPVGRRGRGVRPCLPTGHARRPALATSASPAPAVRSPVLRHREQLRLDRRRRRRTRGLASRGRGARRPPDACTLRSRALHAVAVTLQPGEGVFAFLDDTYIACAPERVATLYGNLADALWDHARVQLNHKAKPAFGTHRGRSRGTLLRSSQTPTLPLMFGSGLGPSGVLASRALPLEHAVARVCREGGARVARNVWVTDMNIDVPVSDARCIDAHGLPLWHGAQLALDATIVSPVTRAGEPQPGADTRPGAVPAAARRKRRQIYPELASARRARLVVIGVEAGGRFGAEAASFLRLARHRAAGLPPPLRAAACAGWVQRWSGILAVAAMRAFAASLLELPPGGDV